MKNTGNDAEAEVEHDKNSAAVVRQPDKQGPLRGEARRGKSV
jgi:hypothetical protein